MNALLTIFAIMYRYLKSALIIIILSTLMAGFQQAVVSAQNEIPVEFDPILKQNFEKIDFPDKCKDSLNLLLQIDSLNRVFRNLGYLSSSMVDYEFEENKFKVEFEPGSQFKWMNIRSGNISEELLESIGFYPNLWRNKPVNYVQIAGLMNQLLDYYSNNGYPFASIRLDTIHIQQNKVHGSLQLEKNKLFRFDSLNIISTVAINPRFLERHLGIQSGNPYDQSKVSKISEQIKKLVFVRLDAPPTVNFKGNGAIINLKLEPYKSSRFDLLIGILPDNNARNKFRLTGDITAELYNKLGQGEYAGFRYKSITQGTQELTLKLNYPYLLNLPFGINSAFKLYSNTSLNRDIDFNLGIQYQLNPNQQFNIYWHNSSSRLLEIDTVKILAQRRLPSNLDVRVNGIGFNFVFQKLNYRFNPRSGINLTVNGTIGLKEVLPNQEIRSIKNDLVDFNMAYDSIENGYLFSFDGLLEYYLPIGKVFTLKGANRSGIKLSGQTIYRNEAFRIGGSQVLRGFDEESLFTNQYSIFTLEGRLLISTNSYFFVFGDYGLVNILLDDSKIFDQPYGIGAGLSLDTGAGILQISAAVGSQMGLALDFGSSKVHIGYVSLF